LYVAYKFSASPGQGIESFTGGGGDLLNDGSGRFRLADLAYSPVTATGRYLLKFESRCLQDCAGYDTSSFPYSFTVLRPTPIPLSLDTPITSTFTEPYGLEVYSLNITDPGYYGLFFNPTAAKPALENYDSFVLEAFNPNMTQIQGVAYRDYKLLTTKLAAGNHTLRVNKRYAEAAPYTLSAIRLGPPVPISVPSGAVNASIDIAAQSRFYSLARTANQSVKVSLTAQGTWSACLSMYKILPGGDYTNFGEAPVNQCFGTRYGNGQSTSFTYVPPSDGTYIVQIKGVDFNQTGTYTLSLDTP
jgi:hypothetical protein